MGENQLSSFFFIAALIGYAVAALIWLGAPTAIQQIGSILIATNATLFFIGASLAGYLANIEAATVANKPVAIRAEPSAMVG
jgi:hypothetical protein